MMFTKRKLPSISGICSALAVCMILCMALFGMPKTADAHALLEQSVPEPNTRLDGSPPAVELTFNESIESQVGSLEVLDSKSHSVTANEPVASTDHKSLKLLLPKLGEGVYTVSYQIISADGHPVSGSYVFVVGNPPEGKDASSFDPHKELGHEGHSASTQLTTGEFILYAVRIAYYAALLIAAGMMIWSVLLPRGADGTFAAALRKWELPGMRTLTVAALLYVFVHAREILQGYPADEYNRLFLLTSIGREWIALVLLVFAGFGVLRLGRPFRAVWAAAVLSLESWSGHAVVFKPVALTVLFDFIHLAAAAVWAGGFVLLLTLWFADRKDAGRFAVIFSKAALLSISALVVTGIGMTLLFLPSLQYLFYTSWGTLLLVKSGLVLIVLVVGGILHLRIRRGDLPASALLRMDGALMALIITIAALFTYISPLPANEPVSYHKMGEEMHLTLRISPNRPGVNQFIVKVWLPDKVGQPKSIILRLRSEDRKELGPIDIPVKPYEDKEITSFDGYVKAAYSAEGPFIPFAGRWMAEIRVMDKDDNEKVEQYEFRNY
ncbi:copper resistance protein CopC/CopD [Paenibacillus sp. sptzw28]|uniref:copper resistance CopC/CopD family protein n=1 Tax=Paenibacillus sp. sptzw28 TaxID=715179 RepID=UPI001C6EB144|nr:copper resistance protein CopC [Paenibacillus sp. sptzw28]QYR22915.1 copper resistance protein CopC/CopD [Paenibacillus sp. sptzw28]